MSGTTDNGTVVQMMDNGDGNIIVIDSHKLDITMMTKAEAIELWHRAVLDEHDLMMEQEDYNEEEVDSYFYQTGVINRMNDHPDHDSWVVAMLDRVKSSNRILHN